MSGPDRHAFHMMQALTEAGENVSLATVLPPEDAALAGLVLEHHRVLTGPVNESMPLQLTRTQERFRSYWGVEEGWLHRLREVCRETAADAVVAVGLDGLPYLGCVGDAVRVWYAADEWVWHHLSLIRVAETASWSHLTAAAIKGAYERAYRGCVDRAWVVSRSEAIAMRWFAGVSAVDILPNGVDADFFRPVHVEQMPNSAVFWGRLDFEPNIQALQWFCRQIWPAVRRRVPDATFTIIGFNPSAPIRSLAERDGITLLSNLADLRTEACRRAVVVLPFVSGGGIKNKLLEAASLGRPIVCTPKALGGLKGNSSFPLVSASKPSEWVEHIVTLWKNHEMRQRLGERARAWVLTDHTWLATARDAIQVLRADTKGNVPERELPAPVSGGGA